MLPDFLFALNNNRVVMLCGDTGTGKSYVASEVFEAAGWAFETINMHSAVTAGQIIGKYDPNDKHGGVDSITFAWLPVSYNLESGKTPCHWDAQPNGTTAYLWDRYQIEVNPPLYNAKLNMTLPIFHNDQGTNRIFSLLEFKPGISYAWRVAVGRWCVSNFDNQNPKHQAFLGLASPYTESRTFMYTQ